MTLITGVLEVLDTPLYDTILIPSEIYCQRARMFQSPVGELTDQARRGSRGSPK